MTVSERKLELRRRLRLAAHPRRREAQFTAENNHNPLILQACPSCHGSGKRDIETAIGNGGRTWSLGSCRDCGGTGITGEVEPYFLIETPEVTLTPDANGWLRCPGCGIAFTTRDRYRWTGYRHLACGQRIRTASDAE